jgi:hypothetical protein
MVRNLTQFYLRYYYFVLFCSCHYIGLLKVSFYSLYVVWLRNSDCCMSQHMITPLQHHCQDLMRCNT